jgi:hypothetical protein
VAFGKKVLRGKVDLPERAAAQAQYELDQSLREIFFATAQRRGAAGGCAVVVDAGP